MARFSILFLVTFWSLIHETLATPFFRRHNITSGDGIFGLTHKELYGIWEYSPDFSDDPFPPYPPLQYQNGTEISTSSLRGTRLFGWKGCEPPEQKMIAEAFDDFYTLAQQKSLYKNIDWSSAAAKDFWGHGIPDDTRNEIKGIYEAAQQIYTAWWEYPNPIVSPVFPWRYLWIEVRCSDSKKGKDSSDPEDVCGDAKPDNNNCPGTGQPPIGGGKRTLEAFSDPETFRYSRITFCNDFFKLRSLKEAVAYGKSLPKQSQNDLSKWNNRARTFFHEITHLDYFMNAPKTNPYVSDLEVKTSASGSWYEAYGPKYAKIIAQYTDPTDPSYSGYFSQRNADNFAFYAVAKYVESQIGWYPDRPAIGSRKPYGQPRDSRTHGEPALSQGTVSPTYGRIKRILPFNSTAADSPDQYPGCPDKIGLQKSRVEVQSSIAAELVAAQRTGGV